jgi:cytochrome c-type biogenesis protein CcmH
LETTPSLQSGANDRPSGEQIAAPEVMPGSERDAAIRSMVDGLAQRLENSPQDVDGWINLMRSRIVLGEIEVAATAFRKAREVFVDDPAASGRIMAAAAELGLKAE